MLSLVLCFILLLTSPVSSMNDSFVFNGFDGANMTLNGLAAISHGLLELTNYTKQANGHAFYPFPLRFVDNGKPLSFSTAFVFAILPEHPDVSSHGFAFTLSPSTEFVGVIPSQTLGLFNVTSIGKLTNHIVAIEFDTVKTVEFADIDDNHVGIDVNDLRSLNSSPAGYLDGRINGDGFKSIKLISGDPIQVWIDYNSTTMQLDATISPIDAPKPSVSLVSSKVNLSSILLDEMYVGFSASTGPAAGSHDILGWSFSLNGKAQALDLSKLPSLPQQPKSKTRSPLVLTVALPLAAVIVLLMVIAALVLIVRRRMKFAEILEDWEVEYGPHRFSYKDLFRATQGFSDENLLGFGGFGKVYKGVLPNSRMEIAAKKISHESRQGIREFIAEIVSMGRLRHRNLVQLLGYCRREGELILVYEFMPNSSLDRLLFGNKEHQTLSWNQRFRIIKGVASGLLYLHEGWEQVVIHRDIKASNVLLDAELNGKLGDFGLARLYDRGTNPQTTHIVGTLGYLAPELSITGKATTMTDVYAFGAFLLEVACGRRPMEMREPSDEPCLVDRVRECWKRGLIVEAGDPKLGGDGYVVREMELVLKLGLLCSHTEPMARPSMKQVVGFLEGDAALPVAAMDSMSSSASARPYDDCFDDFILSYPSTTENRVLADSSFPFSQSVVIKEGYPSILCGESY